MSAGISETGRIYRELTEDFIRRMRNWAMAQAGAPVSAMTLDLGCTADRYREATVPILNGEAQDTQEALCTLPNRYRQVVEQFWRFEGRALDWHARHRGLGLHRPPAEWPGSRNTFVAWVMLGHELLKAEFARRSEANARKAAERRAQHAGA